MAQLTLPSVAINIQYGVATKNGIVVLERQGNTSFYRNHNGYISSDSNSIFVPVDPITAVLSGAVQVSELNLPPGLEALLNMLK